MFDHYIEDLEGTEHDVSAQLKKKPKLYVGDNLITDSEDWDRVVKKFNEYEKKAKAFDLIADHVELLKFLAGNTFSKTPMTTGEVEQVADALGITITWTEPEKTKSEEPEPKKKHWWSK